MDEKLMKDLLNILEQVRLAIPNGISGTGSGETLFPVLRISYREPGPGPLVPDRVVELSGGIAWAELKDDLLWIGFKWMAEKGGEYEDRHWDHVSATPCLIGFAGVTQHDLNHLDLTIRHAFWPNSVKDLTVQIVFLPVDSLEALKTYEADKADGMDCACNT